MQVFDAGIVYYEKLNRSLINDRKSVDKLFKNHDYKIGIKFLKVICKFRQVLRCRYSLLLGFKLSPGSLSTDLLKIMIVKLEVDIQIHFLQSGSLNTFFTGNAAYR